MRRFAVIWFGQLVSRIGSGMTHFAMGIWVLQTTGLVTTFAGVLISAILPGVIAGPFMGALVDRWDRRRAVILGDAGAGLVTGVYAALLWADALVPWHLYLGGAVMSIFASLQGPAYAALVPELVEPRDLSRANGMVQLSTASSAIVAPLLAGGLLAVIGLRGVVVVDFLTFVFATATLGLATVSAVAERKSGPRGSLLTEALAGGRYLRERPGLLGLLMIFTAGNFSVGIMQVLVTPLVLSVASAAVLGQLSALAGAGMVLGSLIMVAWEGPRRRIYGVFAFGTLFSLGLMLAAIYPSLAGMAVGLFAIGLSLPMINALAQAIWQSKVASEYLGRISSLRMMVTSALMPGASLFAGLFADRAPASLVSHAQQLLPWIEGPADGRRHAICLGLLIGGLLAQSAMVWGAARRRVRNLDTELPDIGPRPPRRVAAAPTADAA